MRQADCGIISKIYYNQTCFPWVQYFFVALSFYSRRLFATIAFYALSRSFNAVVICQSQADFSKSAQSFSQMVHFEYCWTFHILILEQCNSHVIIKYLFVGVFSAWGILYSDLSASKTFTSQKNWKWFSFECDIQSPECFERRSRNEILESRFGEFQSVS